LPGWAIAEKDIKNMKIRDKTVFIDKVYPKPMHCQTKTLKLTQTGIDILTAQKAKRP